MDEQFEQGGKSSRGEVTKDFVAKYGLKVSEFSTHKSDNRYRASGLEKAQGNEIRIARPPPVVRYGKGILMAADEEEEGQVSDHKGDNTDFEPVIPLEAVPKDSLESILYYRYGYSWPPIGSYTPLNSDLDFRRTTLVVVENTSHVEYPKHKEAIVDFVTSLVASSTDEVTRAPELIWDFSERSPNPLEEVYLQGPMLITQQLSVDYRKDDRVDHDDDAQQPFYFIQPRDRYQRSIHCDFVIVVEDPASALQIIRQGWGPDPLDISFELMRRGIPFRTLIKSMIPPRPSEYRPSQGLGYRPKYYIPHSDDYLVYLQERRKILRGSRCRAALLKGGIIGRLARETLGQSSEASVQCGPFEDGCNGCVIEFDDCFYWDNDLSVNEEELICGVYKVSTGIRSGGNNCD